MRVPLADGTLFKAPEEIAQELVVSQLNRLSGGLRVIFDDGTNFTNVRVRGE